MKRTVAVLALALAAAGSAGAATATPTQVGQKMLAYLNTKGIYSRPLQPYKVAAVTCQSAAAGGWLPCAVTIVYSNGAPGSRTTNWHARLDAAGNVHYHVG